MIAECCVHYETETVKETKVLKLSNEDAWSTLLDTAVLRNERRLVQISQNLPEGQIPDLYYNKGCRARFTLKRDLDKLRNETAEPEISTPPPSRVPNLSSPILPKKCIFCNIVDKFVDGERQQLYSCRTFLVDETIRKCVSLKGDKKILAIATDELVMKEAAHRPCCYRKYTVCFNNSQRENKDETSLIQEAFDAIKHVLRGLYEDPNIIEFSDLTNKAVESLHDLNQEDVSNIRRHLRRKIENEMDGVNFVTVKNRVLVFPETLSTSVIVKRLYEKEIELEWVQKMTSDEKSIFAASSTIRAQVKNMECKMSWLPQATILKTENIELGECLSMFFKF